MKKFVPVLVLALAVVVLIVGCGKSAEMKKMEADLFASVNKMHDEGMALMNKAKDMTGKIDETMAMCAKMAVDHPKEVAGHSDADLKAAKDKLAAAMTSMKDWMGGFKPYDENMKHEEVIAQMTKAKDGITKVKAEFDGALAAATTAMDAHRAQADEIMAKLAKTGKKMVKK